MSEVTIRVPKDIKFADLKLSRDADGMVSFDWEPILEICTASNVDPEIMRSGPEDNVAGLIIAWYQASRSAGEPANAVADDLISEAQLEDQHGGGISYPPGRA